MAVNVIKILRSIVAGTRPTGHLYGEPYANFADNQFGVFDSSNTSRDLIGVPFFSASTSYSANNPVNNAGTLYVANTSVSPGAFNSSQWNSITGGGVPSGTVMLFWQAAAPIGWTKLRTQNDKALRVVSGTGGVSGGTNSFSTVMAQTVVGNTSITTSTMAGHTHSSPGGFDFILNVGDGSGAGATTATSYYSLGKASGTNGASFVNTSGSGVAHNHTITMGIQYIDVILASKN